MDADPSDARATDRRRKRNSVALTDEERESYLKYVLATVGTPEELAADRAWWTDENIRMAMDMNL